MNEYSRRYAHTLFHSLAARENRENRRVKIIDQLSSKNFIFPYTSDINFLCYIYGLICTKRW